MRKKNYSKDISEELENGMEPSSAGGTAQLSFMH
jgi:hypothetical protein